MNEKFFCKRGGKVNRISIPLMSTGKIALKASILTLFAFILLAALGILNEPNEAIELIMQQRPLPKLYFPTFFVLGLILPIAYRLFAVSQILKSLVISPYLILMFGQIFSELILIILVGKGIGVIIGFIFTGLRLIQLSQFFRLSYRSLILNSFLVIQMLIWIINMIHISLNRLIPLILL
ncbi:hypothetical protein [Prochlorococcus sp. MIT 1307]|uniref:hypothetical protein n=1 Tax=Prochlorococcus sp. MIT 1307 TaxID=3096219 RepID=UPI002A747FA8|nr:hypothetical protein [Prochlorococcus sp. MIT 1307]